MGVMKTKMTRERKSDTRDVDLDGLMRSSCEKRIQSVRLGGLKWKW